MLEDKINWPIISPQHMNFKTNQNTRIVIANFISKYATSPDPSIRKTVHNLRVLNMLLADNYVTLDSHMEQLNLDINRPLAPYTDTRLYLRVVNYGSAVMSLFESWAKENFLINMKAMFQPLSITNTARAELIKDFTRMCLKAKAKKTGPDQKKPRT